MPATTPNVGVRTLLNRVDKAPFLIADMSPIGGVFTPGFDNDSPVDRGIFPPDTPVLFSTADTEAVAGCGAGTLRRTVDRCIAAGITANIIACVPDLLANDDADAQMAKMVGVPSSYSGAYGLLKALDETGSKPGMLIAPNFSAQRPGNAANPVFTAFDAVCEKLITPVAIAGVPSSDKTAAVEWAADFQDSLNIIACAQGVKISEGGLPVVVDPAASIAALIAKTDQQMGGPYYSPGNQDLIDVLGPSRSVNFVIDDPGCEANWLLQRGVNSIVQKQANRTSRSTNGPQGKTFWGFLNTCTDPLWRMISVVRTRKAVREAIPRTLEKYIGKKLGPHLVTVIIQSLDEFLSELEALPEPAVLGHSVRWDRSLNDNASLRVGGLVISMDFEETPDLLDLQVYTGRYEAAFNILATEIQAAMQAYNISGQLPA